MPIWTQEPVWDGKDVFVIGGGDSLRFFNWDLLDDEFTIGCNNAFQLGSSICKICIFGDVAFWKKYEKELEAFDGVVFTNSPSLFQKGAKHPWLWVMERSAIGLHTTKLGWNNNVGSSAINLALILGAKRVFLLGFDMCLSKDGKSHYHEGAIREPNQTTLNDFIRGFKNVKTDLSKFPDSEVINVSDCSRLDVFSKVGFLDFWKERTKIS